MPAVLKTRKITSAVDSDGGKIILEYIMTVGERTFENSVTVRIDIR